MRIIGALLLIMPFSSKAALFHSSSDSSIFPQIQVVLSTKSGKLHGSLMQPLHDEHKAIVLIIAGSGPTDRDGNNNFMKNNCLLQLAEGLAANGIASIRYDKRGIAASFASMTKEEDLRFDTYINDTKAWLQWMRKEFNYRSIVIAGHSEGSLIGMIAANGLADKYLSLAGAGEPITNTLKRQLQKQVPNMMDRCNTMIDSLSEGLLINNPPQVLMSVFRPSVQPYLISWFKYNPQQEIKKLKIPVMIAQGDRDLQVTVEDARMLHEAKPDANYLVVEGMNHVFKTVSNDQDNYKSYGEPNRPISRNLITEFVSFILQ
jgi:pimeloyl-ACP methyl ester carboxylesterase